MFSQLLAVFDGKNAKLTKNTIAQIVYDKIKKFFCYYSYLN